MDSSGYTAPSVRAVIEPIAVHRPAAASAATAPRCDASQPRGSGYPYDGGSVSALYDSVFRPAGPKLPYLDSYVPQSLLPWDDWDGSGTNIVLLGMYRQGAPSYLVALDPRTGAALGTVAVAPSHLGGLAFLGSWMFAGDNPWPHPGSPSVRRYRVEDLRAALASAVDSGEVVPLEATGPDQSIDATDFMTVDGGSLYTGNHGNAGVPGLMYRYVLTADGWLARVEGPWRIPDRAQGMVVSGPDLLFSSDNGPGERGELNVVRRTAPAQSIGCVWLPAMPEDLAVQDGRLLLIFEGGAGRYRHDHPVNRIANVHVGTLAGLLAVTDPAALSDRQPTARSAT
ncbi:MAG: hypothetical protein JO144_00320 [Actinobacteria bacterium]|nr:hypothetical protein [Actinomycetota bacterium]